MPACVRDSTNLITTSFFLLFCIASALVRRSANIRIAAISCTKACEARSARITGRDQIFQWKTGSSDTKHSLVRSDRIFDNRTPIVFILEFTSVFQVVFSFIFLSRFSSLSQKVLRDKVHRFYLLVRRAFCFITFDTSTRCGEEIWFTAPLFLFSGLLVFVQLVHNSISFPSSDKTATLFPRHPQSRCIFTFLFI